MVRKILWFRYDLRLEDNEAFNEACKDGEVLPIFIYDEDYWKLDTSSSFHLNFIKDSLNELNQAFKKKYQTKIYCYYGKTIKTLKTLIDQFKIQEVISHQVFRNYFTLKLDQDCKHFFNEKRIIWRQFQQFGIQLENRKRNYWSSQWNKFIDNGPVTNNVNCQFLTNSTSMPEIKTNLIEGSCIQQGGRNQALSLLESFLDQRSENYQKEMSSPVKGDDISF